MLFCYLRIKHCITNICEYLIKGIHRPYFHDAIFRAISKRNLPNPHTEPLSLRQTLRRRQFYL